MEALGDLPLGVLIWYVGLLDSVPDSVRALVAGGLLSAMLRLSQGRVPRNDLQFSLSFTKVSLIALVTVPLVVWLLPVSRIAVLVEKLEPATQPLSLVWLGLAALWGLGFCVGAVRLLDTYRRGAASLRSLPVAAEDHDLVRRLRHWQRRLGVSRPLPLVLDAGDGPRHPPVVRRVVLPVAAVHWPTAAQDLLIIQTLCRHKKRQGSWLLFAHLVACCYWPLPWVRGLHTRLLEDFEVVTDNLAEACYIDDVGYRRALRQLEQRLVVPGARPEAGGLRAYRHHLAAFWTARPWLDGSGAALSSVHDRRRQVTWAEPGERLALLVGQAVFVAVVAGGATLREIPPKVERDFSLTLEDSWMQTFYRDRERARRQAHLSRETYPDGSPAPQ